MGEERHLQPVQMPDILRSNLVSRFFHGSGG
jgi:hypothetical protein